VELDREVGEFHHQVPRKGPDGLVAPVPVDDEDSPEAGAVRGGDHVPCHGEERLHPQGHGAGIRREVGRNPVRDDREHRDPERGRGLLRDALGQDEIHREGEVAVLLRGSDRQDATVVALEIGIHLHPVHVPDVHFRVSSRRNL
jgi:hypothetical protein